MLEARWRRPRIIRKSGNVAPEDNASHITAETSLLDKTIIEFLQDSERCSPVRGPEISPSLFVRMIQASIFDNLLGQIEVLGTS